MWIVSLVVIGLKYYGAINLDWAAVLFFAMMPVWLPYAVAYFVGHSAVRSTRDRKRTTRRRSSASLF